MHVGFILLGVALSMLGHYLVTETDSRGGVGPSKVWYYQVVAVLPGGMGPPWQTFVLDPEGRKYKQGTYTGSKQSAYEGVAAFIRSKGGTPKLWTGKEIK